jgi:hypothetical protein
MLPREERYIREWEQKRGKGKWSYLFLTAIVWGTIVPVAIKAFGLASEGLLSFRNLKEQVFRDEFIMLWAGFAAGFFCFALLMWHLARKKYLQFKQKQKANSEIHTR